MLELNKYIFQLVWFSVYGSPALQFIQRSWSKSKAEKTTTGANFNLKNCKTEKKKNVQN